MSIAEVNGQSIAYHDTGGDGPVLLFSHGFLMDRSMFDAQVAAFSGEYRCVAWDERGFGETPVTGPFTYWDSADDAVALLDHLGIDQAVFVGMSQGGFLSLRAALAHPDRVRSLVLIDTEAGVDDAETLEGYKGMITHWMSDAPLGEVGVMVAGLIIGDPTLMQEWIAIWESRDRGTIEHPGAALMGRDDITGRMGEIAQPVLIVHGTDDQAIPIERAEALEKMLPDCRGLVRVTGAAHAPNMTNADQVNTAIRSFLDTLS